MREHRHQRERKNDAEHDPDRAEAGVTKQDHRSENINQNRELRLPHDLVRSRHDACVATGQTEANLFPTVLGVERLHRSDHLPERFRLVILEEHHHRQHTAIEIGQAG